MKDSSNTTMAICWDPKSPATLYVPTIVNDGDADDPANMFMNYILSDSGVGCNTFESSAIMTLLDARDKFLELKSSSSTESGCQKAVLQLSTHYRKALAGCIADWSDDCSKKNGEHEKDTEMKLQQIEKTSLELLRVTYAVIHLAETFLILPSMMQQDIIGDSIGGGSTYYEDTWRLPGAITADTIRYLRLHHLGDAEDQFDEEVVEQLKSLHQPEQCNGNGEDYWRLIEAYIIRGCLEDAWALISHHSIVRKFVELDEDDGALSLNDYQAASLAEYREGFEALRNIILSAPLPGGRNNDSDEGCDESYGDAKGIYRGSNHNEDNVTGASVVEEEFIEGVPTSAYSLWETSRKISRTGDYPINYEPYSAEQKYKHWKHEINNISALKLLRRRVPQLNKLLELMSGNFRDAEFLSWQEEFCAELLYKIPNIRLDDMNVRAASLMKKYANNHGSDEVILAIMKGNVGQVIHVMHQLGGGSGAALPAVTTSLLSQLLGYAKVLTYPSDNYNLETELLIEASSAIRSSLATVGCHDLGTRITVRLLLPSIAIDSDLRITATLVDTLEHHSPKSDAGARNLLSLCHKLVLRKNVRILDGCSSICIARYLHYVKDGCPGAAVHWLLNGIGIESQVLCCEGQKVSGAWQRSLSSGTCYRKLVTYCTETSRSLLKLLLSDEGGACLLFARANEINAAVMEEKSSIVSSIAAVKVLGHMAVIAGGVAEKRSDLSVVANSIISCLEEKANDDEDGAVSSLARSLRWDLLRLATEIITGDARRADIQGNKGPLSSFDVKGLGILLSVFTIELKVQELHDQNVEISPPDEIYKMRLVLAEGLKRAFIAKNSMKKLATGRRSKVDCAGIYGANFSKHSREEQERAVQMMLEY